MGGIPPRFFYNSALRTIPFSGTASPAAALVAKHGKIRLFLQKYRG
jgi:hypothetical protein